MAKEVLISIQGLQFEASAPAGTEPEGELEKKELEKIETIYPGEYYFRNNTHFALYEELLEGFPEKVKNMMKFRDREFSLIKKGPINVNMYFAEGKKTLTDYYTPFGNILIGLDAHSVRLTQSEGCFEIHISYGLEANYQFIADCDITIKIKDKILK